MKLYIAGAILNADDHRMTFEEAKAMLEDHGYEAANPVEIGACPDKRCWQLGKRLTPWLRGPGSREHTYECYIRYDLIEMFQCDAVCYLPGWETSFGARNEISQAATCGMPVQSLDYWLYYSTDGWPNPDDKIVQVQAP